MREDRHRPRDGRRRVFLSSLEQQLDSLTLAAGVWRVLVLSILCIAVGDYFIHATNIHLGPLYLLPICLASWRLSAASPLLDVELPLFAGEASPAWSRPTLDDMPLVAGARAG